MKQRDYTDQAALLFERFANRHHLTYVVEVEPEIELLWSFPVQPKLVLPLTLGLQNGDELNFGVADFWSYFFPFEEVEEIFETALDAWVGGRARVAVVGRTGRLLQLEKDHEWETIYRADGFFTSLRKPSRYIKNSATSVIEPS